MLELYREVALTRDLPEHKLQAGDVVMLVDRVPHPDGGEEGYVLEIFNALGESFAVATVPSSAVRALKTNEILTVRSLALAG